MKNDFVDPEVMHRSLGCYCMAHGGSKDCFGLLHNISFRLYDADGNELTDENRYTSKPHFKCKCDKCGYETVLPFDPDAPTILY
jgi:spore maturation protein CgeB